MCENHEWIQIKTLFETCRWIQEDATIGLQDWTHSESASGWFQDKSMFELSEWIHEETTTSELEDSTQMNQQMD